MNKNGIIIRLENDNDHRKTEELVRDSFWNVYRPGCTEHYVLHMLRNDTAFVKKLNFVMEKDGWLIGQNIFVKTVIKADDGRDIDVLTMGPICIANDLKRKGYGKMLLDYSIKKAAEMGFGAVLFEGNTKDIHLRIFRRFPCLDHLLDSCICHKGTHAVVDFTSVENNLTVITKLFRHIGQIVWVNTDTMPAH